MNCFVGGSHVRRKPAEGRAGGVAAAAAAEALELDCAADREEADFVLDLDFDLDFEDSLDGIFPAYYQIIDGSGAWATSNLRLLTRKGVAYRCIVLYPLSQLYH